MANDSRQPDDDPPRDSAPDGEGPQLSSEEERAALLDEILGPGGSGEETDSSTGVTRDDQRETRLAEAARQAALKDTQSLSGRPPRTTTPGRLAATVVLTLVAAWLWIAPPRFLQAPPPPEPTPAQVEAALRFAVAMQAERILAHRARARRLPDFLREVGDTLPGMVYDRVDGGTFRLRARSGTAEVEYRSDEPLQAFVAPALSRLQESR